jgi:hypothetical protein
MSDFMDLSFEDLDREVVDVLPPREEMTYIVAIFGNKQVANAANFNASFASHVTNVAAATNVIAVG